jgi:ATP-binding cassette subfamily F protein 3
MLRIDKLTYRIGARVLLDRAEAAIAPGHRVGLVGRNGCGKTTLLRIIAGELEADGGAIAIPQRWRVGLSRQEAPGGPESLIETVLAADAELAHLSAEAEAARDPLRIAEIHGRLRDKEAHSAPARAARILAGLGFSEAAQQRPCASFAGGWRMRVGLAALLFTAPDLLLLDEPTNHLDLEANLWLEDFLRTYAGTVLVVSHDRDLLNRVAGEILHLEDGKLTLYQGGYDRFEQTRALRLELNDKLRARQEAERARIRSFVDRFRFKASKARQAQSRLKLLARMQPIAAHQDEASVSFAFPEPDPLAPPLYAMDDVTLGYDGRAVLKNLNLRLDADDRIGLLGANGNGKSTLIKLLAGRLAPLSGNVRKSGKLRIGYFAQHQQDELDLAATPLVELQRRRPRDAEEHVRAQLGRFGFSQQRAETPIANLSGGEKARLLFALMSSAKPHMLLLDEPTNHLDVVARQALIEAINAFGGAVVIVSHDPHVLELTADRFWLADGGRIEPFDGDMEDYRSRLLARMRTAARDSADGREGGPRPKQGDRKEQRRLNAQRREALSPLRKQLGAAEAMVDQLERERGKMIEALSDPSLYQGDSVRVLDLQRRLGQVEKALAAAEENWVQLQAAWDRAQTETT